MKIAIIGSGPLGLEAAVHFDAIGAAVTLFSRDSFGGSMKLVNSFFRDTENSFENSVTSTGLKIAEVKAQELVTFGDYFDNYLTPIARSLMEKGLVKIADVCRVHKRFLSLGETPGQKDRLHDMFRVVYSVDPKEHVLNQMKENPETFKKLGQDVLDSLSLPVESFEDFDIVIDASGVFSSPRAMGAASSLALNEKSLSVNCPIFYGTNAIKKISEISKESKSIAIVGSGEVSAAAISLLEDWVFSSPERSLKIITTEMNLFEKLARAKEREWIFKKVERVIQKNRETLLAAIQKFEKDVMAWKELPDFERAKVSRPPEPKAQIEFITGYSVSSVDRLLDREGLFITCESVNFRNPNLKEEKELITVSADAIIVGTGHMKNVEAYKGLQINFKNGIDYPNVDMAKTGESGFYFLGAAKREHNDRYSLTEGLSDISLIENDIMRFFSRA